MYRNGQGVVPKRAGGSTETGNYERVQKSTRYIQRFLADVPYDAPDEQNNHYIPARRQIVKAVKGGLPALILSKVHYWISEGSNERPRCGRDDRWPATMKTIANQLGLRWKTLKHKRRLQRGLAHTVETGYLRLTCDGQRPEPLYSLWPTGKARALFRKIDDDPIFQQVHGGHVSLYGNNAALVMAWLW